MNNKLQLIIISTVLSFILGGLEGAFDILHRFSAFFGTLIGSFLACMIVLWMLKHQNEKTESNHKYLITTMEKLNVEIHDNQYKINKIIELLNNPDYNQDLTAVSDWIKTITSSLSKNVYSNIIKLSIDKELPKELQESIFVAYRYLDNSQALINEFESVIQFKNDNPDDITEHINSIEEELHQTNKQLEATHEFINNYLKDKKLTG